MPQLHCINATLVVLAAFLANKQPLGLRESNHQLKAFQTRLYLPLHSICGLPTKHGLETIPYVGRKTDSLTRDGCLHVHAAITKKKCVGVFCHGILSSPKLAPWSHKVMESLKFRKVRVRGDPSATGFIHPAIEPNALAWRFLPVYNRTNPGEPASDSTPPQPPTRARRFRGTR